MIIHHVQELKAEHLATVLVKKIAKLQCGLEIHVAQWPIPQALKSLGGVGGTVMNQELCQNVVKQQEEGAGIVKLLQVYVQA